MYSFSSRVRYSECNEDGTLSVLGLMNYLQDCATFHCEHVGHGLSYMRQHNFAWFVAAWQLELVQMPLFGQDITISTWCYEARAAWAMRNFLVTDAQGRQLVRADSCWFTFDTKEHTARRIPEGEKVYLTGDPRLDMPKTRRRVPVSGTGTAQQPITVTKQHLDTNHHVNNAQYVDMAAEAVLDQQPDFRLRHAHVQYKNMALLGDVIVPVLHQTPDGYTVDLTSPEYAPQSVDGTDPGTNSYAIVDLSSR
ncbi:MAG: acyl-[acyl-carrier-protein] thioesterase [Atopobiaceae bacterium]